MHASISPRSALRVALACLIAAAFVLAGPAPQSASADVDDFSFESHDVAYTLSRDDDGTALVDVVETYVAQFPAEDQNRGMVMALPQTFQGIPLDIDVLSVEDENGDEREHSAESDDGELVLSLGDPDGPYVHGRQVYVVHYTMRNVADFDDPDVEEFYWNVISSERAQPIEKATATIALDGALDGAFTGAADCASGAAGENGPCEITASDGSSPRISAEVPGGLAAGEGWTIAIGFEPGTFTPYDTSFSGSWLSWGALAGAVVAALGAAWGFVVRRTRLRDAPGHPTVVPQFDPPADVDAMRAAAIRGRGGVAVAAALVEQAVHGAIRILDDDAESDGALRAQLVDRERAVGAGPRLLDGMFGREAEPGATFSFDEYSKRFGKAATKALRGADSWVTKNLRRPVATGSRMAPAATAVFGGVAGVFLSIAAITRAVAPPIMIALLVLSILLIVAALIAIAKSPWNRRGAETRDHLEGLRTFIEWAEADRIRMLQSPRTAERVDIDPDDPTQVLHLYERLLPYAIALGLEQRWAAELEQRYPEAGPDWYWSAQGFHAGMLAARIGSFSSAVSTGMQQPSSSAGSGGASFSGGGGGGARVGGM